MVNKLVPLALWCCFPAFLQAREVEIAIADLLKPHEVLRDFALTTSPAIEYSWPEGGQLEIYGELRGKACTVTLRPHKGYWDISQYAYFRVDITNNGDGLVWIRGRLDNDGALDWDKSSSSMTYILPGERATLGFPFQRAQRADDSPEIFHPQGARPTGFRYHWMKFDPEKVIGCRLVIHSASTLLDLKDIQVSLAQPFGAVANAELLELPYLDKFGQVRRLDWPGKVHSDAELAARTLEEAEELRTKPGPDSFNRFGGWKDGPQLEATGFFRVEKYRGRWWFVDPEGRLFFSHGANSVGFDQQTLLKDREALFAWVPSETDLGGALSEGVLKFMMANLQRTYGPDWRDKAYDRVHTRMRAWGLNTVGAWSDKHLYQNPKTPYTPILHVWPGKSPLGEKVPDPFSEEFAQRLEDGLRDMAKTAGSDPLCLGIFIDNELGWYEDFVHNALAGEPEIPARVAALCLLKEKYGSIEALNAAWATQHASWDALNGAPASLEALKEAPDDFRAYRKDRKAIERLIGNRYYQVCHDMMRKIFPNHLYLGSRIHKAGPEVYEEATRYTDVLSVNRYMPLAATGLPKGIDKPVLIAEFHFGAPDRGVPGVGLASVGDQLQRSRAYAAYVLNAVLQPNIVGTHWFAYPDQSAASRPTIGKPGENYQIGFVDVTDTPYPEFTSYSRGLADVMYPLAESEKVDLMPLLESTWRAQPLFMNTPQEISR